MSLNNGTSGQQEDVVNSKHVTSIRIIMEGLILVGIIWMMSSISKQGNDIIAIKTGNEFIKATLSDVPALKDRVTIVETKQKTVEATQKELEHRVTGLESYRRSKQ